MDSIQAGQFVALLEELWEKYDWSPTTRELVLWMRELPKYDYDRAIALVEIWYTHEKIKAREPVMGAVLDAIANAKLASPVRRQVKRATGTAGPRGRQAARLAAEKILAGPDSPAKCFLLARREVAEFARRSQIAQESTINDGIPS